MNKFSAIVKHQQYSVFAILLVAVALLGCSKFTRSRPTDTVKAYFEASQTKDTAKMRSLLSHKSIVYVETRSMSEEKSDDEFMLAIFGDKMPESYGDELVSSGGDKASVKVSFKSGKSETINLVKEDGWKLAIDEEKAESSTISDESGDSEKTKSSGPVSVSASTLIASARENSGLEEYKNRLLTVTDAELWDIQSDAIQIGAKYGSYSSGYIICKGSFSDYMPYASKIGELQKSGKSPGATVKGMFKDAVTSYGYFQVHLEPCVLSDLEKP